MTVRAEERYAAPTDRFLGSTGARRPVDYGRAELWKRAAGRSSLRPLRTCGQAATVTFVDESRNAYAIRILAYLYALAAAELNGDFEAGDLLRDDLEPADEEHLPEAAVAVAAAIAARVESRDLREQQRFSGLPEGVLDAIGELLAGGRPQEVHLEHGDDPVEVAVNTVTAFWLWGSGDDYPQARSLAQRHCLQIAGLGPF